MKKLFLLFAIISLIGLQSISAQPCVTVYLNDNNLPDLPPVLCVDETLSLCFEIGVDEATFDADLVTFNYELLMLDDGVDSTLTSVVLTNSYTSGGTTDPNATGKICFETPVPINTNPCDSFQVSLEIASVFYDDPACPVNTLAYDLNISDPALDLAGDDLNGLIPLLTIGGLNPIVRDVFPNPGWTFNVVQEPGCDGTTLAIVEILAADGTVCETLTDQGVAGMDGCPVVNASLPELTYTNFSMYTDADGIMQPNPCAVDTILPAQTFNCVENCTNSCPTVFLNDNNLPNLPNALCEGDLLNLCFDVAVDETIFDSSLIQFNYELSVGGTVVAVPLTTIYTSGTNIDPNATGQLCFSTDVPAGPDPCAPFDISLLIQSVFYTDADCPGGTLAYDLNLTDPPLVLTGDDLNGLIPLLAVGGLNPINVQGFPNPNWTYEVIQTPNCDGTTLGSIEIKAADGTVCETVTDLGTAGMDGCPAVNPLMPEFTYSAFSMIDVDDGNGGTMPVANPCAVELVIPAQTLIPCGSTCCPGATAAGPSVAVGCPGDPVQFCVTFDSVIDPTISVTANGVTQFGSSAGMEICVDLVFPDNADCTASEPFPITATAACDGVAIDLSGLVWSDPTVNDAATCGEVVGCTDMTACNYNAAATCDDDSCLPTPTCNTDICIGDTEIIDPLDACTCIVNVVQVLGCTDMAACNYNAAANCDDDSCIQAPVCNTDICLGDTEIVDPMDACACIVDVVQVLGCTDMAACNYNAAANCDDDSCIPAPVCNTDICLGDTEIVNPMDACSCIVDVVQVLGCTNMAANNFNASANCDDDTCTFDVEGCTDPCAPNYNPDADVDNGTCEDYVSDCNQDCTLGPFGGTWDPTTCSCINQITPILGCTDITACNYNAAANCDDNSCIAAPTCNTDICVGDIEVPDMNDPCACIVSVPQVLGCTDPTACNFNENANCDDNSCIEAPVCNTDICMGDIEVADMTDPCNCIVSVPQVLGCTNPASCNYNAEANCDDSSCLPQPTCNTDPCLGDIETIDPADPCNCIFLEAQVLGCTIASDPSYNPDANCLDSDQCISSIFGCTDPCAPNYNPDASQDDGNCMEYSTDGNSDCSLGDITVFNFSTCSFDVVTVIVQGCTDPGACNFDENANCDDGSCQAAPVCNIDPCLGDVEIIDPMDACACIVSEPQVLGCTDPGACNYDENANCDDDSCLPTPICNIDPCLGDIEIVDPMDACSCIVSEPQVLGCTDITACNYNENANCDDSSCLPQPICNTDPCLGDIEIVDPMDACSCIVSEPQVLGCTDMTACNYNAAANCDDDSCLPMPTCNTDICLGDVEIVDPMDPCSCIVDVPQALGCTDITACNYNILANCDDGSCLPMPTCNTDICLGDTEIVDPMDACSCIVNEVQVLGCTDMTACNYNAAANCDDGSCLPMPTCNTDICLGDTEIVDPMDACACIVDEVQVLGCTDMAACNYNADANCDDGSCQMVPVCNTDPCLGDIEIVDPMDACACIVSEPQVLGCTDMTACNYNADANCDDGSCQMVPVCNTDICLGDTEIVDPMDACACIVDEVQVLGCTDMAACNYNADANCDDGSCQMVPVCNTDICLGDTEIVDPMDACSCIIDTPQVLGCTDASANNFNSSANCDDGSCIYTPDCPTLFNASASLNVACSGDEVFFTALLNPADANNGSLSVESGTGLVLIPSFAGPDAAGVYTSSLTLSNNSCAPETQSYSIILTCTEDGSTSAIQSEDVTVYPSSISQFVSIVSDNCSASVSLDPACAGFIDITTPTTFTAAEGQSGSWDVCYEYFSDSSPGCFDASACIPIAYDCPDTNPCTNNAGFLTGGNTFMCEDDILIANALNSNVQAGSGCVLVYVLHDGTPNALGNVLASNSDGVFVNDGSIPTNTELCVQAVVACDVAPGAIPQPSDLCYDASNCLSVTYLDPIVINTIETCSADGSTYTVSVSITGGGPGLLPAVHTFEVAGYGAVSNGQTFQIGPFASGTVYTITVDDDGKGCSQQYVGSTTCNVQVDCDAGMMPTAVQYACAGQFVNSNTAGAQVGAGLSLVYILHNGSDTNIGTVYGSNSTGLFTNDGSLPTNVQLCVTAVIGNVSATGIPTDICDMSNCQPVVFLDPIVIDHTYICNEITGEADVTFSITGGGPGYLPNVHTYNVIGDYTNNAAQTGVTYSFPIQSGDSYSLTVFDDGKGCNVSITSAEIQCEKLPVELISYTGEVKTDGNLLKWATASEIENDYFTLEVSTNGSQFSQIHTEAGNGTVSTPSYYSYLDRDAAAGTSYYRLSQTDFDGTTVIVGVVELTRGEAILSIIDIYPNPAVSNVNIGYTVATDTEAVLTVHDVAGRLLISYAELAQAGINNTTLDVEELSDGIYFMTIKTGDSIVTKQFIKE